MQPDRPSVPPSPLTPKLVPHRSLGGWIYRIFVWLLIAVAIPVMIGFAGLTLDVTTSDFPSYVLTVLIGLACLVLIFWLALLIHELGHVVGAWLVGFRMLLLVAGPLKVERIGQRLRLSLNRNLFTAFTVCLPTTTPAEITKRLPVYVAGGPLASVIAGVLSLAVLPLLDGNLYRFSSFVGIYSLGLALFTLLPLNAGGFKSDGARLLMLLQAGPAAARWAALMTLLSLSRVQRPRELSGELLAAALAQPDRSVDDVVARHFAYGVALDRGEPGVAAQHMAYILGCLDTYPAPLQPVFLIEGAYITARRGDPATARAYLDQSAKNPVTKSWARSRAETAVLLAEGQTERAAAVVRAGLEALKREEQTPGIALEADLLRELLRESDAPVPATPE